MLLHFHNFTHADMRFYNRQLHLVAYPLCLHDLDDPALNLCLKKAIHINLELTEAVDGPPIKGLVVWLKGVGNVVWVIYMIINIHAEF